MVVDEHTPGFEFTCVFLSHDGGKGYGSSTYEYKYCSFTLEETDIMPTTIE